MIAKVVARHTCANAGQWYGSRGNRVNHFLCLLVGGKSDKCQYLIQVKYTLSLVWPWGWSISMGIWQLTDSEALTEQLGDGRSTDAICLMDVVLGERARPTTESINLINWILTDHTAGLLNSMFPLLVAIWKVLAMDFWSAMPLEVGGGRERERAENIGPAGSE